MKKQANKQNSRLINKIVAKYNIKWQSHQADIRYVIYTTSRTNSQ